MSEVPPKPPGKGNHGLLDASQSDTDRPGAGRIASASGPGRIQQS